MTTHGRTAGVAFVMMLACARTSPRPREVSWMTGVWDATFRLDHSPTPTVDPARAPNVHGSLAMLPSNNGGCDVDFSAFGFDVRNDAHPPTLIANAVGGDSVEVTIANEQAETTVTLRGRLIADSIVGEWSVDLTRMSGGGGHFSLARHRSP